jgi:hypothetical protein
MLEQNYEELRVNGRAFKFALGSILYLIDIRYDTFYKSKRVLPKNKEQWFGPEHLEKIFKGNEKIQYRYCQALGNPKKIRETYKNNLNKQKELYLQYIKSNHKDYNSKNAFERLYAIAMQKKPIFQVCLMCYCEPKKEFCHRFWLREALLQKYYKINDLGHAPELDHYYKIDNKMNY